MQTNVFVVYCRLKDLGWSEPEAWKKIDEIIGRANEREKNAVIKTTIPDPKRNAGKPVQGRLPEFFEPH